MTTPAFNFNTLTPDTILNAIESTGIQIDSGLTILNSFENRVYQFNDENRRRYVVKFYRPKRWSHQQILEEHAFAQELVEYEVPVVAPSMHRGNSLHHFEGYSFALFPSVGGRAYEVDNNAQLEWVGRYLGRLHQIGQRQRFQYRPTIDLDAYLEQPRITLETTALLPAAQKRDFLAVLERVIKLVKEHWHNRWLGRRLHGDCHSGNILWHDGPLFVDFDDARNGPAIQDIWMMLNGSAAEQCVQLEILLEAYAEYCDFDQRELTLIEPLRAMRMVHYLAWVARRWNDSAFPPSFPWMVEASFWQKQTVIFQEQVRLLQSPALQLTPMY